jgi:hypothetical protein
MTERLTRMNDRKNRREQLTMIWIDTSWEDIATYIGPNAAGFRSAWEKQRQKYLNQEFRIARTFSWPAFFLLYVWFFYRRQWVVASILLTLPIVAVLVFPAASGGLAGISVVAACMAKSVYLQDSIPKIAKIRAKEISPTALRSALEKAGRPSKPAGIAAGICFAASVLVTVISIIR